MQETITPKRQFLCTASSDSLNLPNGRLRKASLLCIQNGRFRGAGQLWPGGFGWVHQAVPKPPAKTGVFVSTRL